MKAQLFVIALFVSTSAAAEPNRWTIDYASSRIAFTAEQAEAPFDGAIKTFEADVRFDPAQLAGSSADVQIDTASVATSDKERDGILRGTGWFDAVRAAYAVRWAELGDGRPRPPWSAFATEPG